MKTKDTNKLGRTLTIVLLLAMTGIMVTSLLVTKTDVLKRGNKYGSLKEIVVTPSDLMDVKSLSTIDTVYTCDEFKTKMDSLVESFEELKINIKLLKKQTKDYNKK